jgi:ATP-dependent Clp protease ATP-binding subunit ClpA
LLLDEIEKAHPDVFNILLQVMEDAVLTNSEGKSVSFRNVILIMTSNIGVSKTEQHGIGFIQSEIVSIDEAAVKQAFSPEFRNRLDAIVAFDALDRVAIARVVQKFIGGLQETVAERGIDIEITDAAKKWLAEKGYDAVYGARPLGRLIAEKIKQPLSRLMLFGPLKQGGIAKIAVESGDLVVQTKVK